ncbi:MAG: DUF2249 domain-containing protein [Myxococcota bacterium]
MSDALAQRPVLRDILPAFHPAFAKLNHPVLGKVLPKLVTVEDAARIAGVDVEAMLAVMNLPGPPAHAAPPAERTSQPTPPWLVGAPVRTLDARPLLDAGLEPFAEVMRALRSLAPGEVLTVLAPFEPAPLLRLMGDRGWETHVAWEGYVCRASFWLPPDKTLDPEPVEFGERLERRPGGWRLDVRGLEPPRPLELVLAAIEEPGSLPLTVVHHREPALLFPRLEERGLTWEVRRTADHVEIRIDAR